MATRKCIAKLANSKKTVFALVDNGDASFSVLKLCENYDGQVHGGMRRTWRTVKASVAKTEAREVFYHNVNK